MVVLQTMLTAARLLGFLCSVVGYVLLARKKLGARIRYSWAFVLSSIACVVYFGGLVRLLMPVTWAVFAGGLGLFLYYMLRKRLSVVFNWQAVNTINAVFVVVLVVLVVSLWGARFVHYDNFSHWGLVVKYMLVTDHFPDAGAAIIDFKTYPLGTSAFLYYFCKIVGHTEGLMLVGQALLILACFFAMFSVVWDRRRLLLSAFLGFCFALMSFFNIAIRINNLLVDFLLPCLALAAVATMSMHRYQFNKMCLFAAPMLGLLVVTKNSGLFFAAICYGYFLYLALHARKYGGAKRLPRVLAALGVIVLTLCPFFAWQLHTKLTFGGVASKHTMSMENFDKVYAEKTPAIVGEITEKYLGAVFNLTNLATLGILVLNVVVVAAWLIGRFGFKKKWRLLYGLIALDIAVILYYVGIWAMFILTMPTEEALILAGFERYASSMVVFFIGALALFTAVDMEKSMYVQQGAQRDYKAFKTRLRKTAYQYATLALLCLMAVILLSEINGMNSMKEDYPASLPARVQAVTGDNWQGEDGARYLVYAPDTDSQVTNNYLRYVSRYYLFAPNVDAVSSLEGEDMDALLAGYDYLVVVEDGPLAPGVYPV